MSLAFQDPMLKKLAFHPFLFALYPVLALLSVNVSQVLFSETLRAFVAALLLAGLLLLLFRLLAGDWLRAALLASLTLILFFSYGQVYSLLQGVSIGPLVVGRIAILVPLWVVAGLVAAWFILRIRNSQEATFIFNVVGLLILAFPLYTVLSYYIQGAVIRSSQKAEIPAALRQQFSGTPPDIYYIVLDMHARTDVLQAFYDYDNSWFTEGLRQRGFYVADESTSNYSSTLQSISSSLNMRYINDLEQQMGAASSNREPLGLLLKQNQVFQLLRQSGYQIGAFKSDDFYTEFRDEDHYMKPSPVEVSRYQNYWTLSPFESLLVHSTAARLLYDLGLASAETVKDQSVEAPYNLHRLTVEYALDHLPDFARQDGAYFVFAHIVAPHPPYIFDRKGNRIEHTLPYSLSAPGRLDGGPEYVKLYADQLDYIDTHVLDVVDEILSRSDTPPIIIIQGDHGPVSYFGEDEVGKGNMWEQHAILNAYYFPDGNYAGLYPSITPVNSFRVVLNTYFGGSYDMLPDKNYFLPHARPYDFQDVTARVKSDRVSP